MLHVHSMSTLSMGLLMALPTSALAFTHPSFHNVGKPSSSSSSSSSLQQQQAYRQTNLYSTSSSQEELEATTVTSEWENVLARDGIVKINSALSSDLADSLLGYVEDQKIMAWFAYMEDAEQAQKRIFYAKTNQNNEELYTDLLCSILRGGFSGDYSKNVHIDERHMLADGFQEVLGENGTLTSLFENLVSSKGELYEMSALITNPGNDFEQGKVQSKLPDGERTPGVAPLYTILLALNDVNKNMGPISFLMNTHTGESSNSISNDDDDDDDDDESQKCRLSTMKKGDAIVFDSRILFSYNINDTQTGSTSTMLNLSFRNPKVQGDLGYEGSLRPGYNRAMNLGDLKNDLLSYSNGDGNAFEKYGDGIKKPFENTEAS